MTWGVAIVSILLGLVWWLAFAIEVMSTMGVEGMSLTFSNWRFWFAGVLFTTVLAAGVALLMTRRIALAFYGVFVGCILLLMLEVGAQTSLVVILVAAIACTAWTFVLLRRGRFRRPMP